MSYQCELEILPAGDCPDAQPCVSCFELIVTNNNATRCSFTYYNCDSNQYVTQSLGPNTATSITCACPTVESRCELDVVVGTQCSGPTPTPTPTCSYKEWTITTAVVNCVGGIYTCTSPFTRLVYTDCTVTDIFDADTSIYENPSLSFPWTGYFLDGTDIYQSIWVITGSVSFEGVCGGPC
jgi:hypothetical protein